MGAEMQTWERLKLRDSEEDSERHCRNLKAAGSWSASEGSANSCKIATFTKSYVLPILVNQ